MAKETVTRGTPRLLMFKRTGGVEGTRPHEPIGKAFAVGALPVRTRRAECRSQSADAECGG